MSTRKQLAIAYILQAVSLGVLVLTRRDVTLAEEFNRILPFLLFGAFLLTLATALAIEDIYPRETWPRYQFWRWAHPLTLLAVTALYVAGAYYLAMYFGFSLRWNPSLGLYTFLRQMGGIVGFIGAPIAVLTGVHAFLERFVRRPSDRR